MNRKRVKLKWSDLVWFATLRAIHEWINEPADNQINLSENQNLTLSGAFVNETVKRAEDIFCPWRLNELE